jgi:hypothetical protein
MRDWVMLIGTLIAAVIVAGFAAAQWGTIGCALACLLGGKCIALRDHNYRPHSKSDR